MNLRIVPLSLATSIALVVLSGGPTQAGLVITPIFDSSITSGPNATGVVSGIETAIHMFESTYSNNINVTIEFQSITHGLGESSEHGGRVLDYQTFYNALVANDANPAAIAGLTANGGDGITNPVTGTGGIFLRPADLRALGFAGNPGCHIAGVPGDLTCGGLQGPDAIDSLIGINTNDTFEGTPVPHKVDLTSVAEHEIDEALGLGSDVGFTDPSPEDLFRYVAPGVFAPLAVDCSSPVAQAYLSYSGAVALTNTHNGCDGGDWGDWQGSVPQVQNAGISGGVTIPYGPNEIAAMTAIGYTLAQSTDTVPEPATWAMLLLGFSSVGFVLRLGRRRDAVAAA